MNDLNQVCRCLERLGLTLADTNKTLKEISESLKSIRQQQYIEAEDYWREKHNE